MARDSTHHVLLRTVVGQEVTIGVKKDGDCWVDGMGNRFDAVTGEQIGEDFGVLDLETLQEYWDVRYE